MWLTTLALLSAQPAPDTEPPLGVYEQRIQARLIDERCEVFTDTERALLEAAIKRARDDAVLEGFSPVDLNVYEARQADRFSARCLTAEEDFGILTHRAQIDSLNRFDQARFDGRNQAWTSWRGEADDQIASWRVVQTIGQGNANFGIFQHGEDIGLAISGRGLAPAYAMAFIRDVEREPTPVDLTAGGLLDSPGGDPVSRWGAPSDRQRRIFAARSLTPERATQLAPAAGTDAFGFVFPDSLVNQLSELEPREGVQIDVFDATSTPIARYWVEIGAFDAALAFLSLPYPEPEPVTVTEETP